MEFGHIEIFVKEPMKAKEFYEKVLGFEITEIQNNKFVWMKFGENEFLLRPGKHSIICSEYKESDIGFVFYTEDVQKKKEELISKGLEFKGTDGSEECLTFTDTDGNWFQLVNPNHT
ncbi:MAG: VOC family protein [Ignavibacteria bacterium]|nr:VOC family protein [Ignavibacteria bacterium]